MCFLFTPFCLKHFSFQKGVRELWSWTYIGLHVKYPLFLPNFNETWIFYADFRKISFTSIKFHKNSSSGSPAVAFALTYGQTGTVAFRNLDNVPKNVLPYFLQSLLTIFQYTARYAKWPLRLNSVLGLHFPHPLPVCNSPVLLLGEETILQRITFWCS